MSYLETKLNTDVLTIPFDDTSGFPNYILWAYSLDVITLYGVDYLRATPTEKRSLTNLRKDYAKITMLTDLSCVFQLTEISWYAEKSLMEEQIAFYVPEGIIFMPFSGLYVPKGKNRIAKKFSRISPVAQRILLTKLYDGWDRIGLSEIAKRIGVSRMSVSRAFDEIAFYVPELIQPEGNRRYLVYAGTNKEYYHLTEKALRSPVAKEYRLGSVPDVRLRYGGMSAISHYSMLNDNSFPTFALSANEAKNMDIEKYGIVPDEDEPVCIIQVLRYIISYEDDTAIDPISGVLSLQDHELADPRVEAATEEILERILK
jgi:hypothetical protein